MTTPDKPTWVSMRAMNPLSHDDDPRLTFCDLTQAKATTATRFFRDEEMFRALREHIVPHTIQLKHQRSLDIWSAGCSSGEETYSLAMVAVGEYLKAKKTPQIRLFGTDISHDQIRKAKSGEYLNRQDSALSGGRYVALLARFSRTRGAKVKIHPKLVQMCQFGVFDLRKRPSRHTFNYIVCNHVLQYYDIPAQLRIIENMYSVLRPNGLLFLEGLTAKAIEPANLRPVPGYRNVFHPPPTGHIRQGSPA